MSGLPLTSDPAGRHDWFSNSYVDRWIQADDADRSRVEELAEIASRIELPEGGDGRILDVGAGFGALTRQVVERFPDVVVVLQDFSRPMLDRAATRLADEVDRLRFVLTDLRDPTWTDVVGGPFDAVVSSLAIHNVRDANVIAQVDRDIHRVLQPHGQLLDYDLLDGHFLADRRRWLDEAGYIDIVVDTELGDRDAVLYSAWASAIPHRRARERPGGIPGRHLQGDVPR